MFNTLLKLFITSLVIFSSQLAISSECINIRGRIHTTVQDPTDPSVPTLGTISIRTEEERLICGIQGYITGVSPQGLPELTHNIACKNHETFTTTDTVTTYIPQNTCEIYVEEESILTTGVGDFENYTGVTTTVGTLNTCNGQNDFKYRGELCPFAE